MSSPARYPGEVGRDHHATQADVRRHLTETDSANGFANRFLWLAVRRSKLLPDGGDLAGVDWEAIHRRMARIVAAARRCERMTRDARARDTWHAFYGELSAGKPGLLGAVLSRAEPQTMRLACLYALLDGSGIVRGEHLAAALEVWQYCQASARLIFGAAYGDPDAEKLLAALRETPGGLTRKEITRDVFAGHRKRQAIAAPALRAADHRHDPSPDRRAHGGAARQALGPRVRPQGGCALRANEVPGPRTQSPPPRTSFAAQGLSSRAMRTKSAPLFSLSPPT